MAMRKAGEKEHDKQGTSKDSNYPSLKHRLAFSSGRWVRLLALTVLGAAVFEMILPLTWDYAKRIQLPYSPPFVALTTWLAVVVLVYVVSEPIRIRKRQWGRMLWYPPVWLAVPLAWGLAAASERLPVAFRKLVFPFSRNTCEGVLLQRRIDCDVTRSIG